MYYIDCIVNKYYVRHYRLCVYMYIYYPLFTLN